jgi:elongation factor G
MLDKLRNIGIIAHVDAGKTTLTERILYYAGSKHKAGDVDDGNTTTDYDPLEAEKGITIQSAAVSVEWDGTQITLIDTPGHVDFTAEVERSLRVLDGAVGVFCAVGGVEVQSETVWHQANRHKVPRIGFVNKLDRTGADFFGCLEQMKEKLSIEPAVCTLPAGQSADFTGVIDLVRMKFWKQDADDPAHMKYTLEEIPAAYLDQAKLWHEHLLEAASHGCDTLLECIVEGKPISEDMLRNAIRHGTLAGKVTPVLCGSAKEFHGVRLLLDAVNSYLPSPAERPPVSGSVPKSKDKEKQERKPDINEPLSALAFKTISESHGDLVFVRIYSGKMEPGMMLTNAATGKSERISHIYRLMGARRDRLEEAGPGEIVAAVGLRQTYTGHTLCDQDKPILLEEIRFPEPVISQAITPAKNVDETKLAEALARLVRDDPTLRTKVDAETSQLILSGMGELHLEVAVHKLMRDFKVLVTPGKPMVSYRQTLAKPIELEYRYIKQTGGRGKYAVIAMRFKHLTKDELEEWASTREEDNEKPEPDGLYFVDDIYAGAVPREYIPSVEYGWRQACRKGAKYGFPCVDIEATLFDGKSHEVDSSQQAFELCAVECFKEAQLRAGIVLLEPIMNVVIHAPGQYLGDLTRDVSRRRGEILDTSLDKGRCLLHAYVPLAELFGYTSELRNFTSGTASFSMEPSHYAPVKEELADLREAV